MLQSNKAQSEIRREPLAHDLLLGADNFQAFVSFVRRQLPAIMFVTICALILGGIYILTARPSYTGQAQLLIDARKLQVFQQQSILGDIPIDTAQVESQVEVLKSENVASAVIKKLHLSEDSEFAGSGGGLIGALITAVVGQFAPDAARSDFEVNRQAMREFQRRLSVRRLGLTYVIQIGFESYSPERAAQIANAIADAYIDDQLEAKYQATRRASVWLQDRIRELRDQVSNAERAVVDFKATNNIVSTGGTDRPLLGQQQVAELNSQLVIARTNTAEAKARLDRIESVLQADLPTASFGATVTDTLKSDVVSKLRSQYLELAAREADWSIKYGKDHVAVVNLRNQMREIRNSIFEELKRLGETYKSDYEIAKQREISVQRELAQAVSLSQATDAKSVTLRELQSTAQTYKSLYDNFLQRYMESVQQQSFPITEARVISAASRPLQKSSPRTLLVLVIAGVGGIALGFTVGSLRDLADRVFRTGAQVENLLDSNCIALVPLFASEERHFKASQDKNGAAAGSVNQPAAGQNVIVSRSLEALRSISLVTDLQGAYRSTKRKVDTFTSPVTDPKLAPPPPRGAGTKEGDASRTIVRQDGVFWPIIDAPFSRFAEAIRSIKLANDLNGTIKPNKTIGLTSALPNEGKSTIAFSVAQLMAQVGARTILVDCDLRNPSLSRTLAPDAKAGLFEVITEKGLIDDVIWNDPTTRMAFLPAVVKFRSAHSSEILGSASTKALFDKLRESYDYVVVDLPPLAPIVDVRATAHLVDSFVFVIEWGRTKTEIVEHALGHADGVYDNLLGVVLNKVDMDVFGRYASDRESYYYNKHYERYGYME